MGALRRSLPLVLIAAGIILTLIAGGLIFFGRAINNPGPVLLPEQLDGYPIQSRLIGKQAVAEIAHLHGIGFPLNSGGVGVYGEHNEITIWVAGAPANFLAQRMLVDMQRRIAEGNSPFHPVGAQELQERKVYELEGLNQAHFYFRSGPLLIWVAVDDELASRVIDQVLAFYP